MEAARLADLRSILATYAKAMLEEAGCSPASESQAPQFNVEESIIIPHLDNGEYEVLASGYKHQKSKFTYYCCKPAGEGLPGGVEAVQIIKQNQITKPAVAVGLAIDRMWTHRGCAEAVTIQERTVEEGVYWYTARGKSGVSISLEEKDILYYIELNERMKLRFRMKENLEPRR